jgi:hypothetical protein
MRNRHTPHRKPPRSSASIQQCQEICLPLFVYSLNEKGIDITPDEVNTTSKAIDEEAEVSHAEIRPGRHFGAHPDELRRC